LIRLSTAHAKCRLSALVEEQDTIAAEEILRYALFKEVVKISKSKKKRKLNDGTMAEDEDTEEEEDAEGEEEEEIQTRTTTGKLKGKGRGGADDSGVALPSSSQRTVDEDEGEEATQQTVEEESQDVTMDGSNREDIRRVGHY
jgi:DNA replication licensing factor MCM3